MNEVTTERPAFMFGYSTILPSVWIILGVVLNFLVPGKRLGMVGTGLMLMGVASLIGWLFAKRHGRRFTNTEYWKIIIYCFVWAISLEFLGLLSVIVIPQFEAGHVDLKPLAFAVLFTMVFDALLVWLAFRQTARRVIDYYLNQTASARLDNTKGA